MIQNCRRLCQLNGKFLKFLHRNLKTKVEKDQNKVVKYTNSINLPKTKFPSRLNPNQRSEVEESIRTVSSELTRKFHKLIVKFLETSQPTVLMATREP